MSFITKAAAWVASLFKTVTTDILPVVSEFLNAAKIVVESPLVADIAAFVPDNIGTELLNWIKDALPKASAEFDLIFDLTSATTPTEVNAELTKAFSTVTWADETAKEKYLTSFGATLFAKVHALADGTHFTFGQAATVIEQFYQGLIDAKGNAAGSE